MKSKKHLIIIVAITMIAAVVSVQLCGCLSIAEFKKLFEDSGPRGLYSAGVAQDYFSFTPRHSMLPPTGSRRIQTLFMW